MGTNSGVEVRIGWDESEQKEFFKAIRQPLMVQTPLQLVIENLFSRLQTQATFMQQMKEKMDRIAVKDVTADELLARIKLLESQQGDAAGPKLNPFNQQEIISRLEALEKKMSEGGPEHSSSQREGRGPAHDEGPDLETRLSRLESRLRGVYNLNGKLVAVEQIATGLGVAIPDLEYPTGGGPPAPLPTAGTAGTAPALPPLQAWRPPVTSQPSYPGTQQLNAAEWPRPGDGAAAEEAGGAKLPGRGPSPVPDSALLTVALSAPHTRGNSPSHSPRLAATPTSPKRLSGIGSPSNSVPHAGLLASSATGAGSTAGGPVSAHRVVQLGQEVGALRSEAEALRGTVDSLVQQVAGLRAGLGSNAVESLSRLQQVEEGVSSLRAQVADLAAARRDAAARTGSEVTFADLSLLRSQVEGSVAEARAQAAATAALAERELPTLATRVEELGEALKKKGEPRDIDALFHERLNALEGTMGDMKTELLGSIEAAMESAVKVDDLQALEEVLEAKAPAEALRLLQQQTHALSQAVAGIGDAIALRPHVGDALRGGGASGAASGPLVTKLRCLTCDQPIKQHQSLGLSSGGSVIAKGGFLPRLESMPAKEGPPGGPGLMVADLRASKEERLSGLQAAVSGRASGVVKAGELEDYAHGVGLGGLGGLNGSGPQGDGSPGRAVERSRASRVVVGGGLVKPGPAGPPAPSKPVFL
ncbi:hypothetical protein PLESTB_000381800 [Pleodorina starrii]|uniref:Uncharacterized protein n=1 Tax=Pleodorina starrii TaxID=330485 RepID=A0A9W6BE39_9CHLO|nr:hypothetical protein PLESTM_000013300 [Pleodorina starrii]GLC50462.1 hypothetical protein PLESTB_000381800 [Pleodorina starrii]GLC73301.1 hypothetical protein PLESTF_001358200 [Pleodorina starrii]